MQFRDTEATTQDPIEAFILRWAASGAAERANFQSFITELCDVLGVDRPEPARADAAGNRYTFEHPVTFRHQDGSTSTGFIDLYRRGAFVMEAKQGSDQQFEAQLALWGGRDSQARKGTAVRGTKDWTAAMQRARGQAERYAKALPIDHGWPPFLIIVDVGHCFELYADFSLTGKSYSQFPDAQGFRIPLDGLRTPEIRERLRLIWTDPLALDPSRRAAEVTRAVSRRLAVIARALESEGHHPELVAGFLMRCLFSMFAEDVGLLPDKCFTKLLETMRGREPKQLVYALETLWTDMDRGTPFSGIAANPLLQFDGGLFRERTALPLAPEHLGLLIEAAKADWRDVEPAIFGTFLEQALDPRERRKLGAEFTPRRWVERLVMPAVIEPLRERWNDAKATALAYGIAGNREAAVRAVNEFHHELCHLRILDPACGSGNFLYVTMEHLKRLEGEVLDLLRNDLGEPEATLELERFTVDPHQFLGLEINPRAATIAEVVLWIGYLQWHFRTRGRVLPAQPVLKDFHNIWRGERGDAILAYDRVELVKDEQGRPVTRWDGDSMRTDLVTGREVPDETKRVELYRYINPRPAEWPEADFIIGNPPFIGTKRMRDALGDGYVDALAKAYRDMPRNTDFVMFWWRCAADLVRNGKARRFGLITTNSLPQVFNRKVVASALGAKKPLSIVFAIPDHPWYLGGDMSAVRIAMTVGIAGKRDGQLFRVVDPRRDATRGGDELLPPLCGLISANLTVGADTDAARSLLANEGVCRQGVKLGAPGFIVSSEQARHLASDLGPDEAQRIYPYLRNKDVTGRSRDSFVIDLYGLSERESANFYPRVYQFLLDHVRSSRQQSRRRSYREKWWIFVEPRPALRRAIGNLHRYIVTPEVAKFRPFVFVNGDVVPDASLYAIASDDAYVLGILSSIPHKTWALHAGGRFGVGNDPRYQNSRCFDPFPFPPATEAQQQVIRDLAEQLDAHRKRVLDAHRDLTLTGLYNVLEKLTKGEALSAKERDVHERGLVSVMKHLHERIDDAVFEAYGWPRDLGDEEILARLVALNQERRAEEAKGLVRRLRPDYQAPAGKRVVVSEQGRLDIAALPSAATVGARKPAWPRTLPERVTTIRGLLAAQPKPAPLEELARRFRRAPREDVREVLNALVALGLAHRVAGDRYAP
jgi:hypothetical protein